MALKDFTKDLHEEAEKNPFAQLLLSGKISVKQYFMYLHNLLYIYNEIEDIAGRVGILKDIKSIIRSEKIANDLKELQHLVQVEDMKIFPSTLQYVAHLSYLEMRKPKEILAHLYTRHFGDLYGGQIVKTKVPGSGTMYEFDDRKGLIEKTRTMLSDDLADEARVAFRHAIYLFEELSNEYNLQ